MSFEAVEVKKPGSIPSNSGSGARYSQGGSHDVLVV